jgi:predicted nucleic acid-binding protein
MVVDASVVVSRIVPNDMNHAASRTWLTRHVAEGGLLISPALLLPEVARAIARRTGRHRLARHAVEELLRLPALRLLPIDDVLARAAANLSGRLRLRGADAVYVAAAAMLRLPLVTWDAEQRERAAHVIEILSPGGG